MKKPYEMTTEEYLNKDDKFPELPARVKMIVGAGLADFDEVVCSWHKRFIKEAIEAGRVIPANVLQEYSEMVK